LRAFRAILAAVGLGMALASCGSRIPAPEPGTAVSAEALPHPKPGLWSWDSQAGGKKQFCLSGRLLSPLAFRPGCPVTRQIRTGSGAYVVEATCATGEVHRTWAKASGDYTRSFSLDVMIDDTRGGVSDHADYRYLGPCAAGQHPDDVPG
jgi:hypothetical protein